MPSHYGKHKRGPTKTMKRKVDKLHGNPKRKRRVKNEKKQ